MDDFNPLEGAWLQNFCSGLEENDRVRWGWWVGRFLGKYSDPHLKACVWNNWISLYWDSRNRGKPVPLSDPEKEEMLKWALELDSLFHNVVQKILETSAPVIRNQRLYETFHKKGVTSQFPDEASQLLIFTLRKAVTPFFACEDVAALVTLLGEHEKTGKIFWQSVTRWHACSANKRVSCVQTLSGSEGSTA